MPGAKLVIKDAKGTVKASWTSTNTPKMISGLTPGLYSLCETLAPKGYVLETECIKFEVYANGTISTVIMYNKPVKVEVKKPVLSIAKIDSLTNKSLAGATLVIKNSAGKVVKTFKTQTKATQFNDLKAGNYTLSETTAPIGYLLSKEVLNIKLIDGKVTTVTFKNTKKPVVLKKTKLQVSKQDITNNKELPGATLVIKDAKGTIVKSWISTNTPKYFEGLTAGNYTLCETIAPKGYELKKECINFTLTANNEIKKVIMYNEPIKEEIVTKVQISKQDITNNKELPGAKLVIKDANGTIVKSWTSTNTPKYFEGLTAGNYTLCETIAPKGYELKKECVNFTVKKDGNISKVVIYNEKIKEVAKREKVKLSKQDIATKSELPGATLVIKDANGTEIKRWISSNEPVYFELPKGTYILEEIQAPNGYILSTEKINFEVQENGSCNDEIIMFNTKEVEVPITDSNASLLMYATGIIGMLFGAIKVTINAKL